jgi:anti-sigma factor RsiW
VHCELTETRLHAYFDGELDAAGAASFEQHLRSCPECASALASEQSLRQVVTESHMYAPASDKLHRNILKNLPAASASRAGTSSSLWRWAALAAVLLLAVFLGRELLSVFRTQSETVALATAAVDAHLRSLQPGHLTDVQSSDQHTVKPWFDGKVNFAPPVPDFANDGFPLLGGRLDVLDGRTTAALVYGRRKHIINVFVVAFPREGSNASSGDRQGYHWVSWQTGPFAYIAVSDVSATDLQQLRQLFQKQP